MSREERKLAAIMAQFEQLDRRERLNSGAGMDEEVPSSSRPDRDREKERERAEREREREKERADRVERAERERFLRAERDRALRASLRASSAGTGAVSGQDGDANVSSQDDRTPRQRNRQRQPSTAQRFALFLFG